MISKFSRGSGFGLSLDYAMNPKKKPEVIFANFTSGIEAVGNNSIYPQSGQRIANIMENHAKTYGKTEKTVLRICVSPAPADQISTRLWGHLCQDLLKFMGLDQHQAIGILHRDTKYPKSNQIRTHLHLIVNAVSLVGKCVRFRSETFLDASAVPAAI